MFKNILVSVSNKTGIVDFLRPLVEAGARVVSTGGTYTLLKGSGLRVTPIEEHTGFPEVMDGRVRTLHPKVHMALLARKSHTEDQILLKENQLELFDLVICNLYPFESGIEKKVDEAQQVELIDIGGPTLLRAASKNFESVAVVCDPSDYAWLTEKSYSLNIADRRYLAAKVFQHTAQYDATIAKYFLPTQETLPLREHRVLLYGENPHQEAVWMTAHESGWQQSKILQGKELSYNNLLDLESALRAIEVFSTPAACVVKHNSPCGFGRDASSGIAALKKALEADPVSRFGGIVSANFELTTEMTEFLSSIFLECIVVPSITEEAIELLRKKSQLRVLVFPKEAWAIPRYEYRSIRGGILRQTFDQVSLDTSDWKYYGKKPDAKVLEDLTFSWNLVAQLKSNAISIVHHGQSLGLGMGQVNRVDAVEHAITRAEKVHGKAAAEWVLASDGFFPFVDSVERIAQAGVRWVIQPGGSKRDDEVLKRCEELGISMVLTGKRHFRH